MTDKTPIPTDRPLTAGDVFHFHKSRQEAGYAPVTAVFADDTGVLLERDDGGRRWVDHSPDHSITFVSRPAEDDAGVGEARAMAFGFGRFVVDTGCFQQTPAVFICPVDKPGEIGASARHLGHDRHTLLPGEQVMTFPTVAQAQTVADALVGTPTPPVQLSERERALEGALEPFANLGVTSGPEDEPCSIPYRITRGSILRARAALTRTTEEG